MSLNRINYGYVTQTAKGAYFLQLIGNITFRTGNIMFVAVFNVVLTQNKEGGADASSYNNFANKYGAVEWDFS